MPLIISQTKIEYHTFWTKNVLAKPVQLAAAMKIKLLRDLSNSDYNTKAATSHLLSNLCKRFDTLIMFLKEFFAKKSTNNKSMKVIQHAKSKISYTEMSSSNVRSGGRLLFWYLSLLVMC